MNTKNWQAAMQVIEKIEQAGFEAVVVGGAVRDLYLQKASHDVDVATSALPTEVKALFSTTIDVGIEHGTVLVTDMVEPIEVTTYRTDGTYVDHRRPDAVQFVRTLKDDLQRRDFTMNAMALTRTNELIDLYGGKADIDAKMIRAVGDPVLRFQEDALRMLRAVRFSAQLGFAIEEATMMAIKQHAATIQYVAMERIHAELSKIWTGKYVAIGLASLEQSELASFLPGQFKASQWADFQTEDRIVGRAYLCVLNADFDAQLLTVYKCSNKDKAFVKQVLQAYKALEAGWQPVHYFRYELYALQTAYRFAQWQQGEQTVSFEEIEQNKLALPIQQTSELAVSGHDFMQWTSKKRGPWLKQVLNDALQAVLNGEVANDPQQLKEWLINAFNDEG